MITDMRVRAVLEKVNMRSVGGVGHGVQADADSLTSVILTIQI